MRTSAYSSVLSNLFVAALFVGMSAAAWLAVNGFDIAREEGFDPFRYEYFARFDLPEYLAGSYSYSIVLLLKFIYQYLPFYTGFVVFIGACLFLVLNADGSKELRHASLSPIAFFYIAQTGKDGLAILAIACVAIFATKRLSISRIATVGVVLVALIVRPPLVLFLPLTFVAFRFGLRGATVFSILLSVTFLLLGVGQDSLILLEGIVSDEGSGALAQMGREITFGYSPIPIIGRLLLLLSSPFIQPIGSVLKFLGGTDPFVLFEGACQILFLFVLIRHRIFSIFIVQSIPFVILVAAASPFYHFRYMAILYPVIFTLSSLSKQRIELRRKNSRNHNEKSTDDLAASPVPAGPECQGNGAS